jgi:transcriptional repressor NrdR
MSKFMACPECESRDSKTTDTREHPTYNWIVRRRVCLDCGNRFKTYEMVEGEVEVDENL